MAPIELQELKVQLQELLDKGFIRPSLGAPRFCLLGKRSELEWNDLCEMAFQTLKRRLTSAPTMIVPERGQRYKMFCDALKERLGCVLMQFGRVVAYGSQ